MKKRVALLLAALAVTMTACDDPGHAGGGWYPVFIQQPAPIIQQQGPAYRAPGYRPPPVYRAPAPAYRPPVRTK